MRITNGTPPYKKSFLEVKPDSTVPSLLRKAWELDSAHRGHILRIRQYQPVYLLPLFMAGDSNDQPFSSSARHATNSLIELKSSECKLQIGLKSKIYEDIVGKKTICGLVTLNRRASNFITATYHVRSGKQTTNPSSCSSGGQITTFKAGTDNSSISA